jgi:phosphopantothenate synthetase
MHAQANERIESAVLALVLAEHPTILTLGDLVMEIDDEIGVFDAVRALVAVGLLRREGGSVLPTRAVLAADRLEFS